MKSCRTSASRIRTGCERIFGGQLPDGDFGIQVVDENGNGTTILPLYSSQLTSNVDTSSATYVDLGFPAITVIVGASGMARVSLSSFLLTGSAGAPTGGFVGVGIDGSSPTGVLAALAQVVNPAGAALEIASSGTVVVSGLTPGSHTFKAEYCATGASCAFQNTYLCVEPV